jgi:hypothetical protein
MVISEPELVFGWNARIVFTQAGRTVELLGVYHDLNLSPNRLGWWYVADPSAQRNS